LKEGGWGGGDAGDIVKAKSFGADSRLDPAKQIHMYI